MLTVIHGVPQAVFYTLADEVARFTAWMGPLGFRLRFIRCRDCPLLVESRAFMTPQPGAINIEPA